MKGHASGGVFSRFCRWLFWDVPGSVWGKWVVLGGYGIPVAFFMVWICHLSLAYFGGYVLVWFFLARWRWNLAKIRKGTRPLVERRSDI